MNHKILHLKTIKNNYVLVKANDKPEILEHPLDSIVLRDDPVTMKCRASGTGIIYTWFKNGNILPNDKNSLLLKDGSLFLIHAAGG